MPPDRELRVVDINDHDVKPHEVGEIILRGPNVMKEYYKNPKATAETMKNGWLHTGDMGYYDDEGYLYYTDRMKDMIVEAATMSTLLKLKTCSTNIRRSNSAQ